MKMTISQLRGMINHVTRLEKAYRGVYERTHKTDKLSWADGLKAKREDLERELESREAEVA